MKILPKALFFIVGKPIFFMEKGLLLITYKDLFKLYKSEPKAKIALEKYNFWFPAIGSPQLAGLVADLMCDGHLQGDPWWRFDYTFKFFDEKKRFENELYSLFKIKGRARQCTTNKLSKTFNYGVNCRQLARLLNLCGVPFGNKVYKSYSVPEWILSDRENFRRFVQRAFSCEGTVWTGNNPGIRLEFWKEESLLDSGKKFLGAISFYLYKYFKIQTTNVFTGASQNVHKDGSITKPLKFNIKRKESIINFHKEIGFENNHKQLKLKEIVSNGAVKGR